MQNQLEDVTHKAVSGQLDLSAEQWIEQRTKTCGTAEAAAEDIQRSETRADAFMARLMWIADLSFLLPGFKGNFFLVTCDERAPAAAVSGARGNLVWALRRTDPQTGQQRLGSSSLNSRQRGTAALQLPDGVAPPTAKSLQGHSASSHGCTADGRARLITTPAENATQS